MNSSSRLIQSKTEQLGSADKVRINPGSTYLSNEEQRNRQRLTIFFGSRTFEVRSRRSRSLGAIVFVPNHGHFHAPRIWVSEESDPVLAIDAGLLELLKCPEAANHQITDDQQRPSISKPLKGDAHWTARPSL